MSKVKSPHSRKETEASKFLEKPSSEGPANSDVSEGESKAHQADQKKPEAPKQEEKKSAVKQEEMASEVPGKYRKFQ